MENLKEVDGVQYPIENTLNITNGMNYAQFLESLLRIAFMITAEKGQPYATTLEEIFKCPNLDIQKRCAENPFLHQIYNSDENDEVFRNNEQLLCAIFTTKGLNKENTYLELDKSTFIQLLKEANVIKVPKSKSAEPVKQEKKQTKKAAAVQQEEEKVEAVVPLESMYLEADALESIKDVSSFDEGRLGYFDMLECLLLVARDYKFTAEQDAVLTSLSLRLENIIE